MPVGSSMMLTFSHQTSFHKTSTKFLLPLSHTPYDDPGCGVLDGLLEVDLLRQGMVVRPDGAIRKELVGFNEEGTTGVADVNDVEGKGRGALLVKEEEGGLIVEELKLEVAKGFGAWCDAPGSLGIGGEVGLEPLKEGIWRGEGDGGDRVAHCQGFEVARRRRVGQ